MLSNEVGEAGKKPKHGKPEGHGTKFRFYTDTDNRLMVTKGGWGEMKRVKGVKYTVTGD